MPNPVPAAVTGLPAATLNDIHDCLLLALDATERPRYSQPEREARSYVRSALRQTVKLMEGGKMLVRDARGATKGETA